MGNFPANAIEESSFFDDHPQIRVEIHFVKGALLLQDRFFKIVDSFTCLALGPRVEYACLVILSELLGNLNISLCNFLAKSEFCQDLWLLFELVNGTFDACDDASSPSDAARLFWHILRNRWVILVFLEEFSHLVQFSFVSLQDILVFAVKLLLDLFSSVDIFEVVKQIESTN